MRSGGGNPRKSLAMRGEADKGIGRIGTRNYQADKLTCARAFKFVDTVFMSRIDSVFGYACPHMFCVCRLTCWID